MITTERAEDIFLIGLNNPPVNALSVKVRQALLDAIIQAEEDNEVRVVLIRSAEKLFSAGADISEFECVEMQPGLSALVERIEACSKPVVAVINGACLGGGLELALGCHYRVAGQSARFALPEVTLGVLPGAGGTQRLPRLVGLKSAVDIIVGGSTISAGDALAMGIVDDVFDDEDRATKGLMFARQQTSVRRTSERPLLTDLEAFDAHVAATVRNPAKLHAIDACVKAVRSAAELPFEHGLALEKELFAQLAASEQARALRHAFFAERTAPKINGLAPDVRTRSIERVGVIGAGTMGAGIAMNFLATGMSVTLVETNVEALQRGTESIARNFATNVVKGRMSEDERKKAVDLLTPTLEFGMLAQCDLVIEAVFEDMAVKLEIFATLDGITKPGAILASNTSFLDINAMALATRRPQDVVGLHFFSPANIMKLLEVVRGDATADDVLATCMKLAQRIGKIPVLAGVCHGFIGNRMLLPRLEQAKQLLLEGATIKQIDEVSTRLGLPMGPLQMIDLAGVDIGWHRDPLRVENLNDALCAQGRLGQKSGEGYYNYDERRKPVLSCETQAIVEQFRVTAGIEPRKISDGEVAVRTVFVIINEAALILEDRIAQRPSDIDVVWLLGFGWPRWTGGPLWWAGHVGLKAIVDGLERYQRCLGTEFRFRHCCGISPIKMRHSICAEMQRQ